jgi:tRNA (guanine-N7-)-methyltransferase
MGQKKLIRFAELLQFPNVLQYPTNMPGQWKEHFLNEQPITLELACGKGEYTVGMARLYPERNFIGVDLKGNRIWVGAKKALHEPLMNVAFLRTHIDKIADYFAPGEVEEIWITFPDPQLRMSHAKKRLTHPKYLRHYFRVLKAGGKIHLKTDSPDLFAFTRKVIELCGCTIQISLDNLYAEPDRAPELNIKTHYEGLDIAGSNRIHYLCFSLPENGIPDKDVELKEWLLQESGIGTEP